MSLSTTFTPNDYALFENFVNIPHYVLGRKLQPFSLLHLFWLEHIESPFVNTSKPVTLADLELAVVVCSSTSSEQILAGLSAKNAGTWKRTCAAFWHWRNARRSLQDEVKAFLAFQDDYCSLPEFASKGGEKNEKIPYLLLQLAAIVKETGWPEDKVMTMPLGKVVWLNAAFSYQRTGETGVVSDRERATMDAMRQIERLTEGAS